MHKHQNAIVLILILIVSLSCRFLVPEKNPTPTSVTQPPVQTEPPIATLPAVTETLSAPTEPPAPGSLNPTGPYVVYGGTGGVWISNPDGSFLTKLTDLSIELHDLHSLISPQGDRMAVIARNDEGFDLYEIKIPSGESKVITHVYSITPGEPADSAKAFPAYAINDYENLAWQPGEGKLLAFIGAMNGPTADLYLYDTESGEISQLTDGLSQGVFPTWSPNGKYILHYGVSWKGPFGGAIVGHTRLDGVWAVRVEDEEIITMPMPKNGITLNFVGWQDDSHYITYDRDEACGARNLRSVDVTTGKATPIMDFGFDYYAVRSPENGSLLFTVGSGCPDSLGEGIFLLLPGQTTPTKLHDKRAWEIFWMPESRVFKAYPEALFSADGKTRYEAPVYDNSFTSAISQKGYQAWQVIENRQSRVELRIPGADWQTIFNQGVGALIWDPISGDTLLMVSDGLYAASYPDFTPRKVGDLTGVRQAIWLP
jgi:hypothetical protein